jgi:predicted enzyme related to lactoylglutathione lyase
MAEDQKDASELERGTGEGDALLHPPGSVSWLDLGTPDVDTTKAFYGELLGWTFAGTDDSAYSLALVGGQPVAGLGPAEAEGPPYWTPYVATLDIDGSLERFAAAGGEILVPPAAAGEAGTFAAARDAGGAAINFWQAGDHAGTDVSDEAGTFTAMDLCTDRPDQAADFLLAALGWGRRPDGAFTAGGHIRVTMAAPPARSASPHGAHWVVAFRVDDAAALRMRAIELGGTTDADHADVLVDPTGVRFRLVRSSR